MQTVLLSPVQSVRKTVQLPLPFIISSLQILFNEVSVIHTIAGWSAESNTSKSHSLFFKLLALNDINFKNLRDCVLWPLTTWGTVMLAAVSATSCRQQQNHTWVQSTCTYMSVFLSAATLCVRWRRWTYAIANKAIHFQTLKLISSNRNFRFYTFFTVTYSMIYFKSSMRLWAIAKDRLYKS